MAIINIATYWTIFCEICDRVSEKSGKNEETYVNYQIKLICIFINE